MEMAKGEFAAHMGVTPGRVSQWIAEGKIGRDALVGEGRSARIIVEVAEAQVSARRDPGQAMGNGLGTRVTQTAPAAGLLDGELKPNDTAKLIQVERLEQERRRNRREQVEEVVRNGGLVPADEMRRQMGQIAQRQAAEYQGMLADYADAAAEMSGLPARDFLHRFRQVNAQKRGEAAARVRGEAEALPETVDMVVAVE